ncbi:uncharacterized protein LOC142639646 [Castanea sativa]|uniref:uncharacterized protein LOC142639646 n=1 Tax=Castanea sativa TaxID=21020 RepID=UPI003F652BCF
MESLRRSSVKLKENREIPLGIPETATRAHAWIQKDSNFASLGDLKESSKSDSHILATSLGRVSYIRRFVPGLASVTSGLSKLLKKGTEFTWGAEQQEAFWRVQQIMNCLPTLQAPVRGWPLLLYLASNSQAIGALLAQEDDDENEQPIYYVSRTLKDAETRYPRIKKACLVVIYTSQRLKWYFLAHRILLVTKSHPIRALLHQPLLIRRIAQWLVLLSQYDIGIKTLRVIKSQAIADLLAQFPGSEECSLSEEIPGEVAVIELPGKKWTMRFDGSATVTSNGIGIVLSCEDGDTLPLSFKLGFSCSNNTAEYEAYLIWLTIALAIGVKHMRALGDSNLAVSQVKGDFALREQSLAAYRTWGAKAGEGIPNLQHRVHPEE